MRIVLRVSLACVAMLVVSSLPACRTKRTPTKDAAKTATPPAPMAAPSLQALPRLEPAMPLGGRKAPPIDKGTLKRFRAEVCYFGAVGLEVAREAYWESLGNAPPRVGNTPSFGSYPEWEKRRRGDKPSLAEEMGRLPFDRHVRSCSSAKHLKEPAFETLDPALDTFDGFVSELNRTVSDASRYYARKEWSRDGFKKGLEYHQKLSDTFSDLDQAWQSYGEAVASWRETLGPIAEELGEGGKISQRAASTAARLGSSLLQKPTRDAEAVAKHESELTEAAKRLASWGSAHPKEPFPKIVGPKLDELSAAVAAVSEVKGKLTPRQRWELADAVINVLEANHRALVQHLRGDDPSDPMNALPSRLLSGDPRRPALSVKPKAPPAPKTASSGAAP